MGVCVCTCVRVHESNPIADGGGTVSKTILAEGTAEGARRGLRHCPSKIDES